MYKHRVGRWHFGHKEAFPGTWRQWIGWTLLGFGFIAAIAILPTKLTSRRERCDSIVADAGEIALARCMAAPDLNSFNPNG